MPSALHVFFASTAALLFWGAIGFALGRRLLPLSLVLPAAPALGWAAHSALALPLFRLIGFSPGTVAAGSLAFLAAAYIVFRLGFPATTTRPTFKFRSGALALPPCSRPFRSSPCFRNFPAMR